MLTRGVLTRAALVLLGGSAVATAQTAAQPAAQGAIAPREG
jgi:hypothetical protein